jgi:hypothetical protein
MNFLSVNKVENQSLTVVYLMQQLRRLQLYQKLTIRFKYIGSNSINIILVKSSFQLTFQLFV